MHSTPVRTAISINRAITASRAFNKNVGSRGFESWYTDWNRNYDYRNRADVKAKTTVTRLLREFDKKNIAFDINNPTIAL